MPVATPLDDLLALMKTLQGCIADHGAALRKSEALTRYCLIDPLLRELGWDTSDPAQVVPEYSVSDGRADYALLVGGKSQIMIEAKSLGTALDDAVIRKGITYCTAEGTPYFALTDGEHWRLYETHRPVPAAEKIVVRFGLQDGPVEWALAALDFWRTRVEAGRVGTVESPHATVSATRSEAPESSARRPQQRTKPSASPIQETDAGGWVSVASYVPKARVKPAEVRFPTGETERTTSWSAFNESVVAWLVRGGYLTQSQLPVQIRSRFVVAARAVHPNGKDFTRPRQAEGVFVETNYSGGDTLRNILHIITEKVDDLDPSEFRVRLNN